MKHASPTWFPISKRKRHAPASLQGPDPDGDVKGDAHDTGKNLVGVGRLQRLRGHRPRRHGALHNILKAAKEHQVDIIGLSGLITPSLEEMAHVAGEMKRQGLTQPLLIGGATTSRAHTAIKIATNTDSPVVYVPDASRAVGVATKLLSTDQKAGYVAEIAAEYETVRAEHAGRKGATLVSLADARANRFTWNQPYTPVKPAQPGRHELTIPLAELVPVIDWSPFFQSWDLAGPTRPSSTTRRSAKPPVSCSPTRRRCWRKSSPKTG
jgi:5-methyltetrahydrofolate--homocysteine methyltransferase